MAASIKTSSRYNSFDTRSSASSSSSDLPKHSALRRLNISSPADTLSVVKSKPSDLIPKKNNNISTIALVKKFMEKRSSSHSNSNSNSNSKSKALILPDVLKNKKTTNFGEALHKKLFLRKGLTEVKSNTRTLGMVLTSERELLSQNKDLESQIAQLKLKLEEKNSEVEKLKDLCLKQREEIKSLKSAILFPDVMNSQLEEILEKQGSELRQAKQVIPTLQRQVTSLTGQLQCLAQDLAEVKADKYSATGSFEGCVTSPRTPNTYDQEATNSLDFSSGDPTSPASPDEMLLQDFNPCLTPFYAKTTSKEFEMMGYEFPHDERFSATRPERYGAPGPATKATKLSRSSDCCKSPNLGKNAARVTRRSDESKFTYGKQMHHRLF